MAPDEMTVAQMIEKLREYPPETRAELDWNIDWSRKSFYLALEVFDSADNHRFLGVLLEATDGRPL